MHVTTPTEHGSSGGVAALQTAYTVEQAAKQLGVSDRYAWQLVSSGQLPSIKIAGRRRVFRADLDAYVDALREATPSPRPTPRPSPPPQAPRPPAAPQTPPPPAGPKVAEQ